MTPVVLVAWLAVGAVVAWRHRPLSVPQVRATGVDSPLRYAPIIVETRRRLRSPSENGYAGGRRGQAAAVLTALALVSFEPVLGSVVILLAVGWSARRWVARRRRQLDSIASDLPVAVDLIVTAVRSGLTPWLAVELVAERLGGPVADAAGRVVQLVRKGARLSDALDLVGTSTHPPIAEVFRRIAVAERRGGPLAPPLERLASDQRRADRRRAEERARRLPVLMLMPLTLCILPALMLVCLVPVVATGVASLGVDFPS